MIKKCTLDLSRKGTHKKLWALNKDFQKTIEMGGKIGFLIKTILGALFTEDLFTCLKSAKKEKSAYFKKKNFTRYVGALFEN